MSMVNDKRQGIKRTHALHSVTHVLQIINSKLLSNCLKISFCMIEKNNTFKLYVEQVKDHYLCLFHLYGETGADSIIL